MKSLMILTKSRVCGYSTLGTQQQENVKFLNSPLLFCSRESLDSGKLYQTFVMLQEYNYQGSN